MQSRQVYFAFIDILSFPIKLMDPHFLRKMQQKFFSILINLQSGIKEV